jgi:hypothetical protein
LYLLETVPKRSNRLCKRGPVTPWERLAELIEIGNRVPSYFQPLPLEATKTCLASKVGSSVDRVARRNRVLFPSEAILIDFAPATIGVMKPGNRQAAGCVRFLPNHVSVNFSDAAWTAERLELQFGGKYEIGGARAGWGQRREGFWRANPGTLVSVFKSFSDRETPPNGGSRHRLGMFRPIRASFHLEESFTA